MTFTMVSTAGREPAFVRSLRVVIEDEMAKRGVPDLAIALVRGERCAWAEGFGSTDRPQTHRVTADTPFSIQSAGKTYTATAFLIAASR